MIHTTSKRNESFRPLGGLRGGAAGVGVPAPTSRVSSGGEDWFRDALDVPEPVPERPKSRTWTFWFRPISC